MTYQTTMTSKGQITIPKIIRDRLGLTKTSKVVVEMDAKGRHITLKPALDFFEVIKKFKRPRKPMSVLKLREYMERNYERA